MKGTCLFPRLAIAFLFAGLLAMPLARAQSEAKPLAENPEVEARLQEISAELRCLVCQNETIAASNADLANDLRREIRAMILAGRTDREITDFMVTRYGDFILYRPRFTGKTLLLWLGPFLFLVIGAFALRGVLKRQRPADAPLSEAETQRLARLLGETPRSSAATTQGTPDA
ncbi:MAG: cytochrome c-type biogenesis protein CcmH [Zoogloeaceae bacterium]|jgi:cytochrome c-type biogenesis protein CcmH|nr:cytochrome c-type biogenesis protein CcmH [Zoogloeaceae bacterium]